MYYEERLIDGILHWRGTPDGEWQIIPAEKLGERVIAAEAFRATVAAALAELRVQAETGAEKWFGHHNEANIYQDFIESISAAIIKLGLQEERDDYLR